MHSLYENLRVYKKSLELVVYLENVVRNFDRYHKYTVGEELRNHSRTILFLVAKANTKADRTRCLQEAIGKIEELKILANVCKELKAFKSFKTFETVTRLIVDISKQCEGWLRSQNAAGKPSEAVRGVK